eukprot:302876_1
MATQPNVQDEKEITPEVKVKVINGGSWETMRDSALQFVNNRENIYNMGQLIDIAVGSCLGQIIIYYWNRVCNQLTVNSPLLKCQSNRGYNQSQQQAAESITNFIATQQTQDTLFKINHSQNIKDSKSVMSITFVWYWNETPIFKSLKGKRYQQTDHILRNHGNNVATIERGCTLGKSVKNPMNLFQNGYDYNKYTQVTTSEIYEIDFDRAYILNTFRFMLYNGDNRVYKYKIEISKDQKTWTRIVNAENKSGWQLVQFHDQFVKHIRFLDGSSTANQYLHLCKFYAFFDYALQQ